MIAGAVMNALGRAHDDLRFVWVCDRRHHEAVRALLSDAVRPRLELRDWMAPEALTEIYDRTGLFLFPSFYEGFGKVFLEAMSRGAIVVAANIAGARDVIGRDGGGLLVPVGDVDAMVSAAEGILTDAAKASELSRTAAAKARSYTWARTAQDTAAFYERLRAAGLARAASRLSA